METMLEAERAGILASALLEGKPCPVCGSLHHPQKAELSRDHVTEEDVKKARAKADRRRSEREEASLAAGQELGQLNLMKKEAKEGLIRLLHISSEETEKLPAEEILEQLFARAENRSDEVREQLLTAEQEEKNWKKLTDSLPALEEKIRNEEESLNALLISHWHFDHTADVPVLMYRLQALNRVLKILGPADPDSALYRLVSSVPCFDFTEVSPGQTLSVGASRIRVCAARHPVPAVGYTVSDGTVTFGYTGDTNTLPSLAEDYRSCDLLLADGLFNRDAWSEGKPHLSAELAARLAADTGAGALIITHLNPFIPRSLLLQEARAVYPGVQLAEAGAVIEL
jgi:ribonuclease BN (tRNA processing enzyme)